MQTRRERRRSLKREAILDGAMEIVAAGGLEDFTVARLAQRLDIAQGALYRYFPGKEAVLVGLQVRSLDSYGDRLEALLADAEISLSQSQVRHEHTAPLAFLWVGLGSYRLHALTCPDQHGLLDGLLSAPQPVFTHEQALEVEKALARPLHTIGGLFEAAVAQGALGPGSAAERTRIAWAAVHGLDHFRKRDRLEPPELRSAALHAGTLRTLLRGWGALPEAVEEGRSLVLSLLEPKE